MRRNVYHYFTCPSELCLWDHSTHICIRWLLIKVLSSYLLSVSIFKESFECSTVQSTEVPSGTTGYLRGWHQDLTLDDTFISRSQEVGLIGLRTLIVVEIDSCRPHRSRESGTHRSTDEVRVIKFCSRASCLTLASTRPRASR